MKRRDHKRLNVNAPVVSLFISAVCGVLLDSRFSPGLVFWRLFFGFSVIGIICTFSIRAVHYLFHRQDIEKNDGNNAPFFFKRYRKVASIVYFKFLYGNLFCWVAVGAFFGYRHDAYVNYYPAREISRHIVKDGSPYSLELRVRSSPYVYVSNEYARPIGGSMRVTRFIGDVLLVKNIDEWEPFTGRVAVTIDGKASFIRIGDRIRVTGRLAHPGKKGNPGDLDLIKYYRYQRILTTLSVASVENVEVEKEDFYSTRIAEARFFETLRKRAGSVLSERLSSRNAAVARGMTLGFRNDVDEQTNDSFRKTGTIHLLAISGLHIALVVGVFVFILRRIGIPCVATSIATIILTVFYLCLTDMRAPVIRASILIITLCVGVLFGRRGTALNTLAFAALLILAINPCELFQLGAQLSFLATGAFLWSGSSSIREKADSNSFRRQYVKERNRDMKESKRQRKTTKPRRETLDREENVGREDTAIPLTRFYQSIFRRIVKALWKKTFAVVKAGWRIWIVSAPLLLGTTNLFTPRALVANPLIWLPATVALLLAFCLIFVGLIVDVCSGRLEWLASLLGYVTNAVYNFFLGTLDCMASPSFASFHMAAPPTWLLWCFIFRLFFGPFFLLYVPGKHFCLSRSRRG